MFRNLRAFIRRNTPIIIRRKTLDNMIIRYVDNAINIMDKNNWSAVNPVIYDLERLRKNTWDQDKITDIKKWLNRNFNYNNRIRGANDDY